MSREPHLGHFILAFFASIYICEFRIRIEIPSFFAEKVCVVVKNAVNYNSRSFFLSLFRRISKIFSSELPWSLTINKHEIHLYFSTNLHLRGTCLR